MNAVRKTITIFCLLTTVGCTPVWREWIKPDSPQAPRTILPAHENWCYKTLADIECYPKPQRLPPESLVSVDPPSRFPLTREDHAKAVAETLKAGN